MQLSRDKVQTILDNAPQGADKKKILDGLIQRGYQLEGVDSRQAVQSMPIENAITEKKKPTFMERVSETAQDVGQVFTGVGDTSQKRADKITDLENKKNIGERGVVETRLKQAGQLAGAGADAISEVFKGGVKVLASQEREDKLKGLLGEFGQQISQLETVHDINNWYQKLPDEKKETVDAVGGALSLASEFIGVGLAKKGTQQVANKAVDAVETGIKNTSEAFNQTKGVLKNQWDNIIDAEVVTPTTVSNVDEALKSPEFGITKDIAGVKSIGDESKFLTVPEKRKLLDIDPDLGKEYVDTLLKSEDSFDNITPFEKAVNDTEKVITKYDNTVKGMGGEIGKIKEKLKGLQVNTPDIDSVVNDIASTLSEKGISFNGNKFSMIRGVNTPFSKSDIKALNAEIADTLKNIKNSKSMDNLLLGMERLDNKINFNLSSELTNSLQGISKTVRGKLKTIRDKALSKSEAKLFENFSDAKGFIDEFKKGSSENKIMALLNVVGSKRDLKLKRIAEEIKRVTGVDITDYAYLARLLSEASGSQSRNRSLLNQYIGEAMTMSPTGIMTRAVEGIANKIINVDKLKEIQKALKFKAKQ